MTSDERLLSAQKQIWSSQLHNLKAQIQGVRDRMGKVPEELRRQLAPLADKMKEAEKLLNEVEFDLDQEIRDAMRHMAQMKPDKEPK